MTRDHYAVLGVSVSASTEELRDAYRRLVRATHPDVAGAGSAHQFQQVQEAWDVLRDPEQRRNYDAKMRRARRDHRIGTRPLHKHHQVTDGPEHSGPQQIHLGLQMTCAEACRGGTLPVRMQVTQPCRICHGIGHHFGGICHACRGRGIARYLQTVTLAIPQDLEDEQTLGFPLNEFGLPHAVLILHVQIL